MGSPHRIFRDRRDIRADEMRGSIGRLAAADRTVLYRITAEGGAIDEPTHIIATLFFGSSENASAAKEELTLAFGYANAFEPNTAEEQWRVTAEAMACLAPTNVKAMSDFCISLAQRLSGTYDGWEAQITKTNASIWFSRLMRLTRIFRRLSGKSSAPLDPETTIYRREPR